MNMYQQLPPKLKRLHDRIKDDLYSRKRLSWPETLRSSLEYREPAIINGEIISELGKIQDIQDIYVYAGFMPPGRNDYVVRYLPGVDDADPAIEKKWANDIRTPHISSPMFSS